LTWWRMTAEKYDSDCELAFETPSDGDNTVRDELVMDNLLLVRKVAARLASKLPPSVEFDDVHGAGVLGLFDAAQKYDPTRGAKFTTYAEVRIHGAIVDYLRSLSWAPRTMYRRAREIDAARSAIEQRTYDRATVADLAQELELTVDQCHHLLMQINTISFYDTEDLPGQSKNIGNVTVSDGSNPLLQLEWKARLELVWEAIETLSERQKLVLWLYYREELTMKEAGSVMGINEARVSQLHSKAIANLRREVSQRLYCQSANNVA